MSKDTNIWKVLLLILSLLKNFVPFVVLFLLSPHLIFPTDAIIMKAYQNKYSLILLIWEDQNGLRSTFFCNNYSLSLPSLPFSWVSPPWRLLLLLRLPFTHWSLLTSISSLPPKQLLWRSWITSRKQNSLPDCSLLWSLLSDLSLMSTPSVGILTLALSTRHSSGFPLSSVVAPP